MFNGIISELGEIAKIEESADLKKVWIKAPKTILNKKVGASISVEGICSTIIEIKEDEFVTEYMKETLDKTTATSLTQGKKVNLEEAIKMGDPIDGHMVLGHVDSKAKVINLKTNGSVAELIIELPEDLMKYTAIKGSITINGVALTISRIEESSISVSLIPHTLANTSLNQLKAGDFVNIEVDMIARYLKSLLDTKESEITYEFLRERNFL